ncbi:sulfatase [Microlunatus parietis]
MFILTDDHAAHAIGCYGSQVNQTPHLDRLAAAGARLDACFCTNAICSPSRASILSGTYSHVNGVTSIYSQIDYRVPNFPQALRESGYRTALFGKWHLGEQEPHLPRPEDFDAWQVFPGQGEYFDPEMITADGTTRVPGYATDIVTDLSLDWLDQQSGAEPFCLMIHHKAPHRPWQPHPKHRDLYPVGSIPEPATLFDDYETRSDAARAATMKIADDLPDHDLRVAMPPELAGEENREERTRWFYQHYLREYLQTVQSVDDNVGRVLDYLDDHGLVDNTIVVYTSDQGFFLGDHGWYDKRFIYEESLRMPFLVRWPGRISPGTTVDEIITNVDFAATFLDACGLKPGDVLPTGQGRSALPLLEGERPDDWPRSLYYRYWEHDDPNHHAWAHYGVRTATHKLIYFYADGLGTDGSSDRVFPPAWELYDLVADPNELTNIADDPAAAEIRAELERELARLQERYEDVPHATSPPG